MDQPKYRIEIFWSDEDGGYIANVPDLLYCSAFGESYEEALHEVLVAMELHLETLQELDRPIPDPTAPPLSAAPAQQERSKLVGSNAKEGRLTAKRHVLVTPREDGWAVMREGNQRASSVHPTQREAEKAGREAARKDKTEFFLHNRQGEIRQRDSYGHDPRSGKG